MDDLISRQAAIDALGERPLVWMDSDYEIAQRNQYDMDRLAIETVPSAQPERKTGRWVHRGCGCFECDQCGERVTLNAYTAEKASDRFRFCYHCGARMMEGETDGR